RIRETYRLNETRLKSGFDIVIVARKAAAEAPFDLLQKDFLALCSQLSLLEETEHA
ncbi:MAG: ribonuclease P protein component, partial [Clostridia bacterium]|nr:ribonuclease P protein component [Clostridia bacterium]